MYKQKQRKETVKAVKERTLVKLGKSNKGDYLPIEPGASHFMEALLEDHLVILDAGELKQDAGGGLGEGEAPLELHLLADGGSLLHAESVRGGQQEGALREEVLRVRDVGLALAALHQRVDLFLPHVRV